MELWFAHGPYMYQKADIRHWTEKITKYFFIKML